MKDTILAMYDEIQTAIDTGRLYHACLNPLPEPRTDTEGNFILMAQWDESNGPVHVHPPKEVITE